MGVHPMEETMSHLTNDQLLEALQKERGRFTRANEKYMKKMIDELIERGVYPKETVPGNPSNVYQMVDGWGVNWHVWQEPFKCPHCEKDLRNYGSGPPFKLEIGQVHNDRCVGFTCPFCQKNL